MPAPTRQGWGRIVPVVGRHPGAVQALGDGGAWGLALVLATVLRFDGHLGSISAAGLAAIIPLAILCQVVTGLAAGLYLGRWRFGSFEEVAALGVATLASTVAVVGIDTWVVSPRMVPVGAAVGAGIVALVGMAGVRYLWRLGIDRSSRPQGDNCSKMLVFGAGEGGAQAVTAMLRDPSSPYRAVGLLDDDPGKRNLRIKGVPVVGDRRRLARAAAELGADSLLIAMPSAGSELVAELNDLALDAGLGVKVLPSLQELYRDQIAVADIRDVTMDDLLGRRPVETDLQAIAHHLRDKRILVTGAGGSIGSELCRQIDSFSPAELIMLDRDESALHGVQLSMEGRALLDSPRLVLADIRDPQAVDAIFAARRPQVVFHAAALKHLTLLERHPEEALKSNVWGTLNVLEAAAAFGVERFVNISTDKAADPACVLGYAKRIAERLTAAVGSSASGTYLSVRFGNVLGSRGSMLQTFQAQVAAGGPITVTDPRATRFFMTIPEAVQLTVQAAAIGQDGEALVLDMGRPVRITDIAHRLSASAPRPLQIVFTGLRPGEKLHEVCLAAGEVDRRPFHSLISHVPVPPLAPEAAWNLDPTNPGLVGALHSLCGGPVGVLQP